MLAISLWVSNDHLQRMNVGLIPLTFQGYKWTHVITDTEGVLLYFAFMFIGIFVAIS
jgi:hypothetical protein